MNGPLYFTFVAVFITWNWKSFYILFFNDPWVLNKTNIAYLLEQQWNIGKIYIDVPFNFLWHILPPVLLTYLAVLFLPRIHAWSHGIYIENYFQRKAAYDEANLAYEKNKSSIEREKTQELKKQAGQKKVQRQEKIKIATSRTQEEKWDDDYQVFFSE